MIIVRMSGIYIYTVLHFRDHTWKFINLKENRVNKSKRRKKNNLTMNGCFPKSTMTNSASFPALLLRNRKNFLLFPTLWIIDILRHNIPNIIIIIIINIDNNQVPASPRYFHLRRNVARNASTDLPTIHHDPIGQDAGHRNGETDGNFDECSL